MTTERDRGERPGKMVSLVLPAVALGAGMAAARLWLDRFQHSKTFVPDRYPNGIWNPEAFGLPAENIWFSTEDGMRLHGWWVPHPQARGTFLYCHGSTGSIAHRIGVLRKLWSLEVNLLAFDYRGYGRSTGQPTEDGLYLDVRAAHDHLTRGLGCRVAEILLFGHSLGGAVAIDCALDRRVAGIVAQATFTHIRDAARAVFPTLPIHLAARRQFRSVDKVSELRIPKLFIHGDADETVPLELGKRLYESAAEPKDFYLVRRGGHNDLHLYGGRRYLRRLSRFRDRCLRA
ncbi:MAG: alpha/beta hydrolase [Thermoanaerobaculia bacterium]